MKLPEHKVVYLLRFWDRLNERTQIIDMMTYVGNRPTFEVYPSEMITETKRSSTINLYEVPTDGVYRKPVPFAELPEYLQKDPIHSFRSKNGIELVRDTEDIYELIQTWRNWLCMTDADKVRSDDESIRLFNLNNREHFKFLIDKIFDKFRRNKWYIAGDILAVSDTNVDKHGKWCLAYVDSIEPESITLTYLDNGEQRIFGETDEFTLGPDILKCCPKGVDTTVGRLLLNVLLVEQPFNGAIEYINTPGFDLKGLEKKISSLLMNKQITIPQYKMYVDDLFFIGHFTELCVPTYSRASLTTDPNMKNLKRELLQKYAGRLEDPEVIAEIESALIAADKAYLKNDNSMRFYGPLGGKPFNIARKKMFLTVGGIEAFSKDSGKYSFIMNSLSDGMDPESIPAIANEIRKGSYNRGHETQLGGAQTKYIVRVFQDLIISEEDCKATRGLTVDFSKHPIKEYLGRYILVGGKWIAITEDNMQEYTGKQYVMRSPMYCRTKQGLCRKCAGDVYAKLNAKHLSMFIVDISSTFTTMSLKAMHGTKLEMTDIGDLNQYLV